MLILAEVFVDQSIRSFYVPLAVFEIMFTKIQELSISEC